MTLLRDIGKETLKGAALHAITGNQSPLTFARLNITGTATDAETVTVGTDVLYLANVTAAIGGGKVTASGQWNNTTASISATITGHGLTVGTLLNVAGEFGKITAVTDVNTVVVARGFAGSTIAAHADSVAITTQTTAVPVGKMAVPLSAPTTAATVVTEIVRAFNFFTDRPLTAVDGGDNAVLFYGEESVSVAETCTNAAFLGGAFLAGVTKGEAKMAATSRVVASGEATIKFVMPFDVEGTYVQVRNASGALVAYDGTVVISGRVVTLSNSGATDAAATNVVTVIAVG